MYFQNYGIPKTWLDKYKKSNASKYPCTSNTVNGTTRCLNRNGGSLIIFIDHCEGN